MLVSADDWFRELIACDDVGVLVWPFVWLGWGVDIVLMCGTGSVGRCLGLGGWLMLVVLIEVFVFNLRV